MASLKQLVDENGLYIWVDNETNISYGSNPFKVIEEFDENYYFVKYKNGTSSLILKECESSNDYKLLNEKV